ncbi:type IV secretory system conjugative DNA transfer family protein [uncultured Gordonia sp.]|uniref:type IV secretory system conjugative DNA transfer family protein n=1 Tax=uncultured Gordonia sp. TaxID=198437 RepID=UPI002588C2A9|nr:ATP-binding protein [uncultured Gordonia sp.]
MNEALNNRHDSLTISALRSSDCDSDVDVPRGILSMMQLLPDVSVTLRAGVCERQGPAHLTIDVETPSEQLRGEMAHLFGQTAEVTRRRCVPMLQEHVWPGSPEASGLGFFPTAGGQRHWRAPRMPVEAELARVWHALAYWPTGYLEIRLAAAADSTYRIGVRLVGSSAPTLAVRGAMTDAFPGLTFREAGECSGDFVGETTEAETVLAVGLPLGRAHVPGFLVAPAAAMPVALTSARAQDKAEVLSLGAAVTDAGVLIDERLSDSELLRHVHMVGATGTGKSTLLSNMVHQLAHSDHGALVLDPHGTLVDRIMTELPESVANRCVVVRADDLENPLPLNPLAARDEAARETAIADIGQMFYELFDPKHTGIVGPRFEDRIAHALRGLVVLRGPKASLLDVPLMLEHEGMRQTLAAVLTDPREKLWWQNEMRNKKSSDYADLVAWCNSKFERFSASPALRAILGSGHDCYDPIGAMDDGRIILVDLAKGRIGETTSRLLGYLLLNRFWVAAMNRSRPERRFHVIVDEAHSVMAGSLSSMLSEGRKFGISVTAAHQFLGQLDREVAEALAANVGTSVVFRSNGPHVGALVAATGDQVSPSAFTSLPTLTAIVTRMAATGVTSKPHSVRVDTATRDCLTASAGSVLANTRTLTYGLSLNALDPESEYGDRRGDAETRGAGAETKDKSFLDEWLAKRAASAKADQPMTSASAGGAPASDAEEVVA